MGPCCGRPRLDGAVVVSLRGGDFELIVGQDFSIGYLEHSADTVRLYIQESCTFRVLSRDAAVRLSYAGRCRAGCRSEFAEIGESFCQRSACNRLRDQPPRVCWLLAHLTP